MKPFEIFSATALPSGVILVQGFASTHVTVLGSNLPVSTGSRQDVSQFSLVVTKGQKGVVAVRATTTRHNKKGQAESFAFLIPVRWDEGSEKPHVGLVDPFVPDPDRLGQASYDGLEVRSGDEVFVTWNPNPTEESNYRRVTDGNLLCRFLVGEATLDEVRAAADDLVAEESARARLMELEKQVEAWEKVYELDNARILQLQNQVEAGKQKLAETQREATNWVVATRTAESQVDALNGKMNAWVDVATYFASFATTLPRWMRTKAMQKRIDSYNRLKEENN